MPSFNVLIERGGVVMLPLVVLSVVSLAIIIERTWFWFTVHGPGAAGRRRTLLAALRGGRPEGRSMAAADTTPYGRVATRMLAEGTDDAVVVEALEQERGRLERGMSALSTIITAAPLLGILGTVLGIIRSFRLLSSDRSLTDPLEVGAGIAEALFTTAAGLLVALVALFPYMFFRGHLSRAAARLESVVLASKRYESRHGSSGEDVGARSAPGNARAGRTGSAEAVSGGEPVSVESARARADVRTDVG